MALASLSGSAIRLAHRKSGGRTRGASDAYRTWARIIRIRFECRRIVHRTIHEHISEATRTAIPILAPFVPVIRVPPEAEFAFTTSVDRSPRTARNTKYPTIRRAMYPIPNPARSMLVPAK